MARPDGRAADELRATRIETDVNKYAEGAALVIAGDTRVLCTASVEARVPHFLRDSGQGWVTGEYGMLPRATDTRSQREGRRGGVGGRTMEIQRLIGRSLRAACDLRALPEITITVDCDVLQADGGTRTAAITGGFVAFARALLLLDDEGELRRPPLRALLAATSVGLVDGAPALDLCYAEDSRAAIDMNVVGTHDGRLVEVQGTAEGEPFPRATLDALVDLAESGIVRLTELQRQACGAGVDGLLA